MKDRRKVDGLRAVAVLPVILFHAGFPAFRGMSAYYFDKDHLSLVGAARVSALVRTIFFGR